MNKILLLLPVFLFSLLPSQAKDQSSSSDASASEIVCPIVFKGKAISVYVWQTKAKAWRYGAVDTILGFPTVAEVEHKAFVFENVEDLIAALPQKHMISLRQFSDVRTPIAIRLEIEKAARKAGVWILSGC